MATKSTRDLLIEQGIITPATEDVRTWTDPATGYVMPVRPTLSGPALARTKAALVKRGIVTPGDEQDPAPAPAPTMPAAPGRIIIRTKTEGGA